MSPARTSAAQLQGLFLKDQPGRGSAFHHTFQKDEKWLKIIISLSQPILLHSIHIYQPSGLSQSK